MIQPKRELRADLSDRRTIAGLFSRRQQLAGGIVLLCLVTFVAYLPATQGAFIWDDDTLLTDNQLVKAPDGLYRLWCTTQNTDYWPMTYSSFWLEWRLWGMNPTPYHVTNIVLHIASALLLWAILGTLGTAYPYLAALLFAVHPVNVESVAWIAQRKNTLAMLFFLASIWCYLREEKDRDVIAKLRTKEDKSGRRYAQKRGIGGLGGWYWLSLLAFVLAMLSKGSVAILPLIILLIVWWQRERITWTDVARTAPFFLVAVVLTAVNIWFQTHGSHEAIRSASFAERLAGAGGVVWFYLSTALAPLNLVFIYPQWQIQTGRLLWWLPLAAVLLVTAVLVWQRNNRWGRPLLFAWAFFCVALAPVLGFIDVYFMTYSLVADHYQHIALIGVTALVASGIGVGVARLPPSRRWIGNVLCLALLAVLTSLTLRQTEMYSDLVTLYQRTVDENPTAWLAQNNLGVVLRDIGRPEEAIEHYRESIRINPDNALAHNNLAVALADVGHSDEAIAELDRTLRLNPRLAGAHNNLGNLLLGKGQFRQSIEHYEKAISLRPEFAQPYNNLGSALLKAGDVQQAIVSYRKALSLDPNYLEAGNNLGLALMNAGRPQEAIEAYREVLRINPSYTSACVNLMHAYAELHRTSDAISTAEKALSMARANGQTALAEQIESWLVSFRAKQEK